MVESINPRILFIVILNESVELSSLLSKFTRIKICKLLSRSLCFSVVLPPFTFVSYISSYFSTLFGKIYANGVYTLILSFESIAYISCIE